MSARRKSVTIPNTPSTRSLFAAMVARVQQELDTNDSALMGWLDERARAQHRVDLYETTSEQLREQLRDLLIICRGVGLSDEDIQSLASGSSPTSS